LRRNRLPQLTEVVSRQRQNGPCITVSAQYALLMVSAGNHCAPEVRMAGKRGVRAVLYLRDDDVLLQEVLLCVL
ncbi:MAG TPA: hypothetical protein DD850_17910, partial [Erwinia persicina]|nr:hypothetical protein [Erwinia persicina]